MNFELVNNITNRYPKIFRFAWVIGDIYVAQKFSLTFEKWLCLCSRSLCFCGSKIVKASFVFDFLARNEESERRNRGVGGERPSGDRWWCGGTITEQKLWSSFILYYNTSVLRSSRKTQTSFSSVVESKNNKWNLQSRVVLITLCFRFFRACRIIKSVSNSQKEVSKKTRRHEQKRRVTKQKSDEKPEK